MAKTLLVIDAHPASGNTFCGALLSAYEDAARAAGATVKRLVLRDLAFDPVRRKGYGVEEEWEPDLAEAWRLIEAADHLCFAYPTWWGGHPALLEGFFERVFVNGKAFRYHDNDPWWDKLLAGKTADVLTTMDTPPLYYWLVYRNCGLTRVGKTILGYVGIKPRLHAFGAIRSSTEKKRARWLAKAAALGAAAAV